MHENRQQQKNTLECYVERKPGTTMFNKYPAQCFSDSTTKESSGIMPTVFERSRESIAERSLVECDVTTAVAEDDVTRGQ